MASLYKRGNIWWVCYMDNGRKFDKSLKTREKKIAQYRKNQIENKIAEGESPLPNSAVTITEASEQFKRYRSGRIVPKTEQTDNQRLERFFKESNIYKINNINETSLKDHLDQRIKFNGISHRTANHTIRIIKTFLNWAVKNKLINANAIVHMEKYKVHDVEQRFLTPDEIKILFNVAQENRIHLLIIAAVYTGMRYSELKRLEWHDIDFNAMIISVRLSKSEKFRKVPLHATLARILTPYRGSGRCFNTLNFKGEFEKIRKAADIGYFRFHDLRHTFAALMIKAEVDLYTLSKILGHSSIVITTKLYGHLYQEQLHKAIGKFPI